MASSFLLISSSLILLSFLFPAAAGQSSGHSWGGRVRIESIPPEFGDSLAEKALAMVIAERTKTYGKDKNYYSHDDVPPSELKMTMVKLESAVTVTRNKGQYKAGELTTSLVFIIKVNVGDHGGLRRIRAVLRFGHLGLELASWQYVYDIWH